MNSKALRHICITRGGQEGYAIREITELLTHRQTTDSAECTPLGPGVIEITKCSSECLFEYPLFFTRQLLPNAVEIQAPSIRLWAEAIVNLLLEQLPDMNTRWMLSIFEPESTSSGKQYSRQRLIEKEVLNLIKKRRRLWSKELIKEPRKDTILVQICTLNNELGFLSIADSDLRGHLRSSVLPYRAGYVEVPDNPDPPSRAFKKLIEAQMVFDLSWKRSETCVDLGASPGGWTYVLNAAGCRVTAVDRSPLDPRLMREKKVVFLKGNALTWEPPVAVDWLVCDVITSPDKTTALLESWLSKGLCRNFCVTIKFKGAPDFQALSSLRQILTKRCASWDGKQLTANKNEVTVVGRVR